MSDANGSEGTGRVLYIASDGTVSLKDRGTGDDVYHERFEELFHELSGLMDGIFFEGVEPNPERATRGAGVLFAVDAWRWEE